MALKAMTPGEDGTHDMRKLVAASSICSSMRHISTLLDTHLEEPYWDTNCRIKINTKVLTSLKVHNCIFECPHTARVSM
jgi:hypothetical protein